MDGVRASSSTQQDQTTVCCSKKKCPQVELIPPQEWFSSSCLGSKPVRTVSKSEFTRDEVIEILITKNRQLDQQRQSLKVKVSEDKSS